MLNAPSHFAHFVEFYERSPMAARFRHTVRRAGALPVRMVLADHGAHADEDAANPDLVIGLILGGAAAARWSLGGRWHGTQCRRAGDIGVTPPDTPIAFEVDGPQRVLMLALPFLTLRARLGLDTAVPRDFGRLHEAYARGAFEHALAQRMWAAAAEPSPLADLFVDSAAQALVLALATRAAGGAGLASPPQARPLDNAAARRVVEAVRRLPARELRLSNLAAIAGLPERTFRARFRASFGVPPHRFAVAARVQVAHELVRTTDRPIADIAAELGFADQSHLTRAFARQFGEPPGRSRQRLRR